MFLQFTSLFDGSKRTECIIRPLFLLLLAPQVTPREVQCPLLQTLEKDSCFCTKIETPSHTMHSVSSSILLLAQKEMRPKKQT